MSTGLECTFIEWEPGKWYYVLETWDSPKGGDDWRDYSNTTGPFASLDVAKKHLSDHEANPGGYSAYRFEDLTDHQRVSWKKCVDKARNPASRRMAMVW